MPLLSFTHPLYLLLLPPALYGVVWVAKRSLAGLQGWRRNCAMGLRIAIVTLAVFALAGPVMRLPSRQLAVMFVLDISDSMPPETRQRALEWINSAARLADETEAAGLIVFGSDAYIEREARRGLKVQRIHSIPSRDYSGLAGAMRLAMAALPSGAQQRVVLISDGNENIGRAVEEAVGAAASGVQVDVVPVEFNYPNEAFVDKMVIPTEVKVGEPFEIRMVLRSTYSGGGTLRLTRQGELIAQQKVNLLPGPNVVTFRQSLDKPRFYSYEAILDVDGDQLAQNNRGLGFVLVRGKPRVLLVESDPADARFLLGALADQQIAVEVVSPRELPASLAEFQSYDSIVLSNVSAYELGLETMKAIRSSVRDLGLGLVMIGGENSFAPGGYRGTPIEEALPVEMDVRKQKVMPVGAVAMILHTCEFPDGNRWARETAASVIDVLGERDKVGVLVYDIGERWGIPIVPAANKAVIKAQLYSLDPGDMPDFHRMMQMAKDGLVTQAREAAVKHIIIISDGDPSKPSPQLMQQVRASKITVSTLSVFPHGGGLTTLQEIARDTGGEYYSVSRPEEIPRIFLKEAQRVMKPAIIEETFTPSMLPGSEILTGITATPPLLGYIACTPKEASSVEVAMATPRDDPLLVTWRYGVGKSVAFTSDAKNRWAAPWIASGGVYKRFWAQLIRWSIRSTARANMDTQIEIEQRKGKVTVDVVDAAGNYVNGLDLLGSVAGEAVSPALHMAQTAPGRYEGEFDAPEKGQYIVALRYQDEKGISRVHTVGTAVPYSPEYRDLRANTPVLTAVAERTGGRTYPPLSEETRSEDLTPVWRHDRNTRQAPTDLWPFLLLAAALLAPIDVGIRRLVLTRADWDAAMATAGERMGLRRVRQPVEQAAAMSRLFKAKAAAAVKLGQTPAPDAETAESTAPAAAATEAPRQPEPAAGRPADVVWHRPVEGVAPAAPSAESTPPPPAARPEPAAPGESQAKEDDEGSTGRLLRAKRRARKDD